MFREIRTLGTARAPYFSSECRLVGIWVNRFLRHGMQRRSRELLHLGAACPEIQRKASGCNCEGSAEFGGIPQRPTGIAHHVVEDGLHEKIVAAVEKRRRPQASRFKSEPGEHKA